MRTMHRSRRPSGQQLKRAAGHIRSAIAKRKVQYRDVLAKELRIVAGRSHARGAGREHGLRRVHAVDAEACFEQRLKDPSRA